MLLQWSSREATKARMGVSAAEEEREERRQAMFIR